MRQQVSLHGTRVSFLRWGEGPPLLILPPGSRHQVDWRVLLRPLGEHLCCYLLEQPEAGPADPCTLLVRFLDSRGIYRCNLLGFGPAASLALEFRQRFPRRCDRAALIGGSHLSRESLPDGVLFHHGSPAAGHAFSGSGLPDFLLDHFGRRPRLPADGF